MEVHINDNLFNVIPLLSSKDIQKGMMGKKFDGSFDGMLFFMKKGPQGFWMKNCIIPLDIIFIDGNRISSIQHSCEPCKTEKCQTYDGFGDLVLELQGGTCKKYDISEGDKLIFN